MVDIEDCRVEYRDDYAFVTLTARLEYHSEHHEGDEVRLSPPRAPGFAGLVAQIERYLCLTLGRGTSLEGRLLKPRLFYAVEGKRAA